MHSQWTANSFAYTDRSDSKSGLTFSVELFPPRDELALRRFSETTKRIARLSPEYFSVTCGAGGSIRKTTDGAITRLRKLTNGIPTAAHLTCIDQSKTEVHETLNNHIKNGVDHIVALRGDSSDKNEMNLSSNYRSALELVEGIRNKGDFKISVAAYPEGHPEANDMAQEIKYLKQKIDAGADQIITQFCFDSEVFLQFLHRVRDAGITVPVIPGILPIVDFERAIKFAIKCGSKIPRWYHVMYKDLPRDSLVHSEVSTLIAVEQCQQLMAFGIKQLHFYSLNQVELVESICVRLGLGTQEQDRTDDGIEEVA